MKKLLFIITIFFIALTPVFAKEELIINDLKIKNGIMAPKFDKYNNYYSVTINEDVKELDLEYKYNEDKYVVEVTNNINLVKNKLIYVSIYDKETKEQNTYIFKIYLENTQTTANVIENDEEIVHPKKENKTYPPIIGAICFILIILIYYVIFLR